MIERRDNFYLTLKDYTSNAKQLNDLVQLVKNPKSTQWSPKYWVILVGIIVSASVIAFGIFSSDKAIFDGKLSATSLDIHFEIEK